MPTARELLEQADALMRRNRDPHAAPAPVLHASPMPTPGMLRRESAPEPPRDAAAPSMRDARPTHEVATPRAEPPQPPATPIAPPVVAAAEHAELEFPVLTEAIEELQVSLAPVPVLAVPAPEPAAEDVPVLTDAVEAIDVEDVAGSDSEEQGTPSFWLDVESAEPSGFGRSDGALPIAHEPDSAEAELDAEIVAAAMRGTAPDLDQPSSSRDASMSVGSVVFDDDARDVSPRAFATPEEASADAAIDLAHDPLGLDGAYATPAPDNDAHVSATSDAAMPATSPTTAPSLEAVEAPAPAEPGATSPPSKEDERARWDALAEELRMQVLQRIDLFTDTGLREQLGERLKPIVDRASAELVASINQHVGELVRAYVAEAIEREIERYRKG